MDGQTDRDKYPQPVQMLQSGAPHCVIAILKEGMGVVRIDLPSAPDLDRGLDL